MSSAPSPASAPASLWDELLRTALLGSERVPAPAASYPDQQVAALLAQLAKYNPEAALLSAAALITTYERSGTVPEPAGELSLRAAEKDDLPRCGSGAASYLRRILEGEYLFLLPELLAALQAAAKRVPEELLPDLLNAAGKNLSVRHAVAAVIGRRGLWLASLNPDWSFLGAQIAPEQWETDTRAERIALLRQLRRSTPEQAIALMQSTWAVDPPEDRAGFIAELELGLSHQDESFLESALDDRRKEVRQRAAELLMRLPQSALVERMRQRVAPLVRRQDGAGSKLKKLLGQPAVEIELPQQCDDAMQRDGVDPKSPPGVGEKAWWLRQMLRAIPPTRWETHLQLSAEQCVAAFNDSEFHTALLPAVAEAAKRHRDPRWAKAVVEIWLARAKEAGPVPSPKSAWDAVLEIVETMSEKDRDELVTKALDRHGDMAEMALAMKLLHKCPAPWSVRLARSFLNLLRYGTELMSAGKAPPYWSGLGDMADLACRMPVSIVDEAQQGWPEDASTKTFFKPIESSLEILQFRSKMLKEISR